MLWKVAAFVVPIIIAAAAFWTLTHLPESWQVWLDGKKRWIAGATSVLGFGAVDALQQFSGLPYAAVLGDAAAAKIGFYMGLAMIVIKMVDMTRAKMKTNGDEG